VLLSPADRACADCNAASALKDNSRFKFSERALTETIPNEVMSLFMDLQRGKAPAW
jgi:hypothetical protein